VSSTRWIAVSSAVLVLGCREAPASGDRVAIDTQLTEQVCRGTIVHAESELARIEAELELAPMSEQVAIHVVDPERIGEWCPVGDDLCVIQPPRQIYVSARVYDDVLARELVRDRLARSAASSTKPMFLEGVATALTQPKCTPYSSWDPPSANEVLSKTLGTSLDEEELFVAGELLRWLLDSRGPDTVLDFMVTLDRHDTPDEVRLGYLERFGSTIDIDLHAHWRPADQPLARARAGCLAPELPRDDTGTRFLLDATFDCGADNVRNDFENPGRAFVEWTLAVDESTAGYWLIEGELPEGVELTIGSCECEPEVWTQPPPDGSFFWNEVFDPEDPKGLFPAVYRLRAHGPIGTSVHVGLIPPCDFAQQNCPAGKQCTSGGLCEDEVEDPGQHGDPCWPPFDWEDAPLPCEPGLFCVGPVDPLAEGICMPVCEESSDCPDQLTCESLSVCTESCDPFAPICEQGWSCGPNLSTGGGGCHPFPVGELGLLEACSQLAFSCSPGLVCETIHDIEGCYDPDAFIDFSGCCTPICDPAAGDPACPPELPNCQVDEGNVLGTCAP
jgi:hypothetical protein